MLAEEIVAALYKVLNVLRKKSFFVNNLVGF